MHFTTLRVVGLCLATATAAFLLFPELLPAPWRVLLATVIGLGAFAAAHVELRHHGRAVAAASALFSVAVVAAWLAMPIRDGAAVRHFSGIVLGVPTMALIARARTVEALLSASLVYALGAAAVLTVGLIGTSVNTGKFVGALRELPLPLVNWLPEVQLGLPGLEASGFVNPNALGGTAVLVLPSCLAIAIAAFRYRSFATSAIATMAATGAVLVLMVTRSRSALFAAMVVSLIGIAFRLRARKGLLLVGIAVVGALGYWVATFGGESYLIHDSFRTRVDIWTQALDRVRDAPLLGIGINQFHDITAMPETGVPPRVAHAHNVFVQVLLDAGIFGLCWYVALLALLLQRAAAPSADLISSRIAAGAGLSLLAVHVFGLTDAIAPGAKVGIFQWMSAGLILGATAARGRRRPPAPDAAIAMAADRYGPNGRIPRASR